MAEKTYIAVDLGASNGRVVIGRFDGRGLKIEEVHRFPNRPVNGAEARAMGMGNYGGADGNIFVRVAAGLWLIQQCRAAWSAAGQDYTFGQVCHCRRPAGPDRMEQNRVDSRMLLH